MDDDLTVIDDTNADTVFYIDSKSHTIYDYLDSVQGVIDQIGSTGDFNIGANTLRSMSSIGHAIGLSKAKLIHGMKQLWIAEKYEESFYQYIIDFGHLSSRIIIDRYTNAWDALVIVPKEYLDVLITHPMKNWNALGAAISQGYEPDGEVWEKLSSAKENGKFLKIIREDIKGQPARSNSITIYLEDNGDLVAWCNDERVNVGYLNVQDVEEGTPTLHKAINRITKGSGIIRRE